MVKAPALRESIIRTAAASLLLTSPAFASTKKPGENYTSSFGNPMSGIDLSMGIRIGFGITLEKTGHIRSIELTHQNDRILLDLFPDGGVITQAWQGGKPTQTHWEAAAALMFLRDQKMKIVLAAMLCKYPAMWNNTAKDLARTYAELGKQVVKYANSVTEASTRAGQDTITTKALPAAPAPGS